jgi:predicted kinase
MTNALFHNDLQCPLLLLVTGAPATGKTTLSRRLAADLKLPLVARDDLKEILFDQLGWSTVEWSQQLGRASFELMYLVIEKLLAAAVSQVVDCNLDPKYATARLLSLKQRYDFNPFQIICQTRNDVLLQRYTARIESGERHPGHVDRLRLGEFNADAIKQQYVVMNIGGNALTLDMTDFKQTQYEQLLLQIRDFIHANGARANE